MSLNVPIPRIRSTSSGSGTPSRVNCEFPLLPTWPPQSAAAATEEEGSSCKSESPCCEGLQCDVGICKRKCSKVGGDCSLFTPAAQCCEGLRCNYVTPSNGYCELDTDVEPPPPENKCSKVREFCSDGASEACPECGLIIPCCEGLKCRKGHCF